MLMRRRNVGPEILLRLDLEDILRAEDEDRIFLQPVFVQVERYAGFAFRADADDEGVDAAREPENFHTVVAAGREALPHQALAVVPGHFDELRQRE